MISVEGVNIRIIGIKEQILAYKLKWFYDRSQRARTLLQDAGMNNLLITLTSSHSGVNTISSNDIRGDWLDCHNDENELTESMLFEICNSVNKGLHNDLDNNWSSHVWKLTYLEYGTRKATIESESTVMVDNILGDVQGTYIPSEWGRKQREAIANAAEARQSFADYFANCKHNENDKVSKMGMKSKYLYAYELLERLPNDLDRHHGHLKRCTTAIITPPGFRGKRENVIKQQWSERLKGVYFDMRNHFTNPPADNKGLRRGVASYILGLHFLTMHRWSVTWKGNSAFDYYDFASEIFRVDKIPMTNDAQFVVETFQRHFE